jgi:peptide/nickel transport system permease protein
MSNSELLEPKRERWYESKRFKRFRRNPLAVIGVIILLFFAVVGFFAPALTADRLGRACIRDLGMGRSEVRQTLRDPLDLRFWKTALVPPKSCYNIPRVGYSPRPKEPSKKYPMGIASGGYDIFYGIVWGTRTSFFIGILVVGIVMLIATAVGGLSGLFGGWLDNLLMRLVDVVYSIPSLVLAMVFASIFGRGLIKTMIAIALVAWPIYARMLRGNILQVKAQDYISAAHAVGVGNLRLFFKHILPNAIGPMVILASLDIGAIVITASTLAFLGLGADVGYADWGQMISFARSWISNPGGEPLKYWYVWFWPSMAIALFVLGWNLLGDAVRDALDPRG